MENGIMTRETRIGLLVALAFIITFGLVLSEFTGRPSPAGRQIRSVTSHDGSDDFSPVVDRTPAAAPSEPIGAIASAAPAAPATTVTPAGQAGLADPTADRRPGDEMISLTATLPTAADSSQTLDTVGLARAGRRRLVTRTYTVRPNDSLRKIARRFYGDEERYRDIFQANRDVLDDESLVVVGQKLVLPDIGGHRRPVAGGGGLDMSEKPLRLASASGLPRVPPPGRAGHAVMDLDQLSRHFNLPGVSASAKPSGRVYVVRNGDNLTRIARKTMKDDSPAAVGRLFRANRDRLTSPDVLTVGMKLNIPT